MLSNINDISNVSAIPRPDEDGTSLAPNKATSMSVQVNEMKRMPAPYTSKCLDKFPSGYDLVSNYSFTMCQLYCHAQAVADNCSCFWPELYIPTDSNYSKLKH